MSIDKRIEDCIADMNNLLKEFKYSTDSKENKKASLLSYWLKDYTKYLRWEKNFDPTRLKKYERGDIVKVNLGYNIGSEEGGLHYAIVVDNNNALTSPVVLVIPLTSIKETKEISKVHPNDIFLGDDIYLNLKNKSNNLFTELEEKQNKLQERSDISFKKIEALEILISEESKSKNGLPENISSLKKIESNLELENISKELMDIGKNLKTVNNEIQLLKKINKEISRMKKGSIALVGQITTVSKLRIYDPRSNYSVLSNIKLSPDNLDKVNDKIKELFIYK